MTQYCPTHQRLVHIERQGISSIFHLARRMVSLMTETGHGQALESPLPLRSQPAGLRIAAHSLDQQLRVRVPASLVVQHILQRLQQGLEDNHTQSELSHDADDRHRRLTLR
jgi:hypothetical protein